MQYTWNLAQVDGGDDDDPGYDEDDDVDSK